MELVSSPKLRSGQASVLIRKVASFFRVEVGTNLKAWPQFSGVLIREVASISGLIGFFQGWIYTALDCALIREVLIFQGLI